MGRPLKIQKYSTNTGINAPGAAVAVDVGYPNFGSLTDPVYNAPTQTLTAAQFLGVVGGAPAISSPTTTYPEVRPKVNIALADGTNTGAEYGRIVRQKGAHKYLVTGSTAVNDGSFIVGQAYFILSYGTTTDWAAAGATVTAGVGDIFTATTVGGAGDGTVLPVGVCILSNTGTPAAGYMSIEYNLADSAVAYASNLTNKMLRDWTGSPGNYSNSNTGEVDYSDEDFYVANFFTDEGTVTWSGAELINSAYAQNGSISLALVENITS